MAREHAPLQRPAGGDAAATPVYLLHNAGDGFARRYERAARADMGRQLARLLGRPFGGDWQPGQAGGYFVPDETLSAQAALELGIRSEQDLFGGVVPYPFLATKALTQPLVPDAEVAPAGWREAFHAGTDGAVLRGYSAFSLEDARRGLARLLPHGTVRIKPVGATGGRGQQVVATLAEGEATLAGLDAARIAAEGVVLEENLEDTTTLSIGRVRVGASVASY